jgi:hypothetical protein
MRNSVVRALLLVGGIAVTTGAAPLLISMNAPFVSKDPYTLFGFFGTLFVLAFAWYFMRTGSAQHDGMFWLLFTVVILFNLGLVTEFSARTYDFKCYEDAAKKYLASINPYDGCFVYPPLVLQCFAWVYQTVAALASRFAPSMAEPRFIGSMVFYLYQCSQFFLVMALFFLLYRLSLRLGLNARTSVLLVAILLVVDNPLLRTIRFNQINLWILDGIILGILFLPRHAVLSGIILALVTALKLYPVTLFVPLLARRNWKAVIGGLVGGASVFLVSAVAAGDWGLWGQFFRVIHDVQSWTTPFRDNSLRGLFSNTVGLMPGTISASAFWMGEAIYLISIPVVLAWFLIRFSRREKWGRLQADDVSPGSTDIRMIGHLIDMCALGLLVSPLVWEHHYLLALPVILWAFLASGSRQLLAVLGAFLILAIPTFDIFPFSYHRLAGLALLLIASKPGETPRTPNFSNIARRMLGLFMRNPTAGQP